MKRVQLNPLVQHSIIIPLAFIVLLVMVIFLTSYLSQQPTPIPKAVEQSDNVSVPEPTIDWGGPMEDVNNDSIIDERDAALMTHE